jgi:hypothetical protein
MNKRRYLLGLALVAPFLLTTPASADVLYDNGPMNGQTSIGSWNISGAYVVADSFILTDTSTLTGVDLGLWVWSGETPASLAWRIGTSIPTSPGGTSAGLSVLSECDGCAANGFDLYWVGFSLPSIVLGPGTYYLAIDSGAGMGLGNEHRMYWDIDDGPSAAYQNGFNLANYGGVTGSNSDSFQILGTAPEPAGTAMFLSGLALVAGLARRKMRA